jgi:hypothetical protein
VQLNARQNGPPIGLQNGGRNVIKRKQQTQHSGGKHEGDVSKSMNMHPFKTKKTV